MTPPPTCSTGAAASPASVVATATHPGPLMGERRTAVIGAALVAIGPITMALYTPAMPVLAEAFSTSQSMIKLTLTAYFTGFALTQLLCGPLTDAFGRKPVTIGFLFLYLASTIVATWAPTIEWMLIARTLQGIGASVGVAASRAIVRDQFTGQASARIMNTIAMMLALGPALAPTIGAITLELFGWREIFWAMLIYGFVLLAVVIWLQHETNAFIDRGHMAPRRFFSNYARLIRDPRFLQPSLMVGFGIGTIYTLASILPFVIIDRVGLSPTQFGFGMMVKSGSFISGTILTSQLLRRMDASRLLPYSMCGLLLASLAMVIEATSGDPSFLGTMLPVGLYAFSLAISLPGPTTAALQGFPQIAGAASALMGFLQFGAGLLGSLVAAAIGDPLLSIAIVPPCMAAIAVGSYMVFGRLAAARTA
ncbi:multidrug effflux MFS transporter [Stappia sp.]|uniref:multidrug effflux MFS transporter n=1 Tax=Stappia sp. TaxID=1870903 RepID=UPI0025D41CF3|nr:multidrug effflux MFS transporter [Stappia sp.]